MRVSEIWLDRRWLHWPAVRTLARDRGRARPSRSRRSSGGACGGPVRPVADTRRLRQRARNVTQHAARSRFVMGVKAYVGLGSNLGPREEYLQRALDALPHGTSLTVTRVSSILETDPVGGPPDQGRFLNAVAEIETCLGPDELLRVLL